MTMQNPERVVTKQDLRDFYDGIYPYLGGGESIQVLTMPGASQANEGKIVEYVGNTTENYTNGYFYKCVGDGGSPETFSWEQTDVQPGNGAELEEAILTNIKVGAVESGTTLAQGTSFTEMMKKIFIAELSPTATFTASGSGTKEWGVAITPVLTLTINSLGTSTPTSIKFYDGTILHNVQSYVSGTNTYTYTMESLNPTAPVTKTLRAVLEYKKSDGTNATLEKSASYNFVFASFYGAVTTPPASDSDLSSFTKAISGNKALTATFNLSNQRACYVYSDDYGNLSSIKDSNGFEYISGYTKTTMLVYGAVFNVYTQNDPVTATGFKQIFS